MGTASMPSPSQSSSHRGTHSMYHHPPPSPPRMPFVSYILTRLRKQKGQPETGASMKKKVDATDAILISILHLSSFLLPPWQHLFASTHPILLKIPPDVARRRQVAPARARQRRGRAAVQ